MAGREGLLLPGEQGPKLLPCAAVALLAWKLPAHSHCQGRSHPSWNSAAEQSSPQCCSNHRAGAFCSCTCETSRPQATWHVSGDSLVLTEGTLGQVELKHCKSSSWQSREGELMGMASGGGMAVGPLGEGVCRGHCCCQCQELAKVLLWSRSSGVVWASSLTSKRLSCSRNPDGLCLAGVFPARQMAHPTHPAGSSQHSAADTGVAGAAGAPPPAGRQLPLCPGSQSAHPEPQVCDGSPPGSISALIQGAQFIPVPPSSWAAGGSFSALQHPWFLVHGRH